ncbi:hypothetical protein CGMCC3_g2661 [Colletotrichum fructicola]|nr:uncharacterized protein CGMCC3_g2661 [Colletotrichum fructicola]KAE9581581.1 hypothetical protein CGMCC3_g2661 [Colletotrichum fructicola]
MSILLSLKCQILAAFLGSALVTIFAVLLAYYYDTIDDDLMTDLDDEFKDEVRTIIRKCKGRVKNHCAE